jgi:PRTRC genetic system protein E
MLFQKIFEIAQDATLAMTFSANREAGTLIVTVVPKAVGDNPNPALHQPLQFEATPEELDSGFADALGSYEVSRKSLADALKDTQAVIDAAKKDATSKAAKAVKGAAGKSAATPAATPVSVKVTEPAATAASEADESNSASAENLFE